MGAAPQERFTQKAASELVEGDYLPEYEATFVRSYNAPRGSQDIVIVLDNDQEITIPRDEEFKVK